MPTKADFVQALADATATHAKLISHYKELDNTKPEYYVIGTFENSLFIVRDRETGHYVARFLTTTGLQIFGSMGAAQAKCEHLRQVFTDAEVVSYSQALQRQIEAMGDLSNLLNKSLAGSAA